MHLCSEAPGVHFSRDGRGTALGEEALRCLLRQEFALILMDVRMPDMDGFQTAALIKERPKMMDVPIIFVSAIAREAQDISRGYQYGAVDYLTKPFDPDLLRAKVSMLVALHLQAERIAVQRSSRTSRPSSAFKAMRRGCSRFWETCSAMPSSSCPRGAR